MSSLSGLVQGDPVSMNLSTELKINTSVSVYKQDPEHDIWLEAGVAARRDADKGIDERVEHMGKVEDVVQVPPPHS